MMQYDQLFLHDTAGPSTQTLEIIDNYHKKVFKWRSSLGYYVAYHALVFPDGSTVKTREDWEAGPHTRYHNNRLALCMVGNFSKELPTKPQTEAVAKWVIEKIQRYGIPIEGIKPHRMAKYASTQCYGSKLPNDWGQKLVLDRKLDPAKYVNKIMRNEGRPEHYISNGKEIAHISRELYDFREGLDWFGDFDDVLVVDEPIIADITI